MKVILEIDDSHSRILTVTAVGLNPLDTRVTTHAMDLNRYNYAEVDENGCWIDKVCDNGGN